MVTNVVVAPPEVAENFPVVVAVVLRFKVLDVAAVAALPNWSSCSTVKAPIVAVVDAVPELGAAEKAMWFGVPADTVSNWVALVSPDADAVMVGEAAFVSP